MSTLRSAVNALIIKSMKMTALFKQINESHEISHSVITLTTNTYDCTRFRLQL